MAIALVTGQKASAQSTAAATTISVSFPANVTAGNFVAVKGSVEDFETISSVQMTGETNAAAGIQLDDTTNGQRIEGWYFKNMVGGQAQVTINFNASAAFRAIGISEWSGVATTTPLDQTASALDAGTAGAAISSPDKTPTTNGQLIWGAIESNGNAVPGANSPYTLLEGENTVITGSEYQIQATAAAVHTDFNVNGTQWGVVMMTFKAAAGAAAASGAGYYLHKKHWSAVT